ncbi:hypothetical protein FITA111629_01115 [Filibacter tadaridae]|uniref:Stage II sporulation protein M n=1 Tax=Filibacter tadaridae TaxID=2483811 RepID=A0A3P5XDH0_9BACL|nr:hypothetical protein [Filibacter tadaridae]VDC29376.1 hypothetical protein FILTAD_02071 [Filibacter tadaridae]
MVRSLSFIHLFVILAVGYIGGALLFREMPTTAMEKLINFYDGRVIHGHETGFIKPIGTTFLFFIVAYAFTSFRYTRFLVLFLGAVKSVFFGLSSSYLLSSGSTMIDYTVWWFPFQLLSCFLFLLYCVILRPPYFMRKTTDKKRNRRALPVLIVLSSIVLAVEMIIYYSILK